MNGKNDDDYPDEFAWESEDIKEARKTLWDARYVAETAQDAELVTALAAVASAYLAIDLSNKVGKR